MHDVENREKIELSGIVEDVVFRKEETGFTVLEISTDGELVTVVGVLPQVVAGEKLLLEGYWDFHASFGRQFKALQCQRSLPSTSADLLKYLSSGVIKGVGHITALRIIEAFGEETFDVLENDPRRLASIKGISLGKALKINKNFNEQFAVREVMIALERFGMSPSECLKAFKLYGPEAVKNIKENPYILCNEGIGISFPRAEGIAESMQQKPEDKFRTMAGIIFVIKHNLSNGHTCLPKDKILRPCIQLLGVNEESVLAGIDSLISQKRLICKKVNGREFVFLPHIYTAESRAAQSIGFMLEFPPAGRETLHSDIKKIEQKEKIEYEEKQKKAIVMAVEKGLLILTGGPGTGKTTALNGILKIFEMDGLDVALTAPTGRAAKRMSDVTGKEAKTIHRLLEVEWDESDNPVFNRNQSNPLEVNAVIVDELSMVDISLFSSLLMALPLGCRLIMVGDSDQLPPVGAGNVLHDLIGSEQLPVVELTEVFRQAMESRIVTNAHKIVKGEMPDLNSKDKDFFFMERRRPELAAKTIAELCSERLPKAYGYSPFEDIQILCPSRKGQAGTINLNKILQNVLNPPQKGKNEIVFPSGKTLREGDKVMQIRNNYNVTWEKGEESGSGIFNGDVGLLKNINKSGATMTIVFDERVADYPFDAAGELELAYAVTVHKSQGNEFEAVIMPAVKVIPHLAYRNLLYTAVTRARSIMIIVGTVEDIKRMAQNNKESQRYSSLKHFLTGSVEDV
ncbi:MAG TPA: ATP-dependent RecD-like DNA helicase [Clostridia bacterium]|nr:ATP-dependent RecD-like DNA helicase [Clostridia bacterium]